MALLATLSTTPLLAQNGRWRKPTSANHPLLAKKLSVEPTEPPPRRSAIKTLRGFISTGNSNAPATAKTAQPARASQAAAPSAVQQAVAEIPANSPIQTIRRAGFTPTLGSQDPFKNPFAQVTFEQPANEKGYTTPPAQTATAGQSHRSTTSGDSATGDFSANGGSSVLSTNHATTNHATYAQQDAQLTSPGSQGEYRPGTTASTEVTGSVVQPAPLTLGVPANSTGTADQSLAAPTQPVAPSVEMPTVGAPSFSANQEPLPSQDNAIQPRPEPSIVRIPEYNNRDCEQDGKECEVSRKLLSKYPIRSISLNISPVLFKARDPQDQADKEAFRKENIQPREWHDRAGELLATGRLVDYEYERLHIETQNGDIVKIKVKQLGEEELCYLAAWWEVPTQCLLPEKQLAERMPTPLTLSWKASAVCGKPNYFENVQLERYGHTAGPVWQPLLSSAHFVGSIATLPYQAGIHPPGECVYPLGYYRPGDCAPWLRPPIPLSVRGGLFQAGVVTGAVAIIP